MNVWRKKQKMELLKGYKSSTSILKRLKMTIQVRKQDRKLKQTQEIKKDKKQVKNGQKVNNKQGNHLGIKGIKTKLIGAFVIPVLFIVALGIISYNKALDGIVNNYESAVQETIQATGRYFDLGFNSIYTTTTQLAVDDKLKSKAEYGAYKGVQKSVIAKLAADEMLSNIHVFSADGVGISTKAGVLKGDMYTDFIQSVDGVYFKDESIDSAWVGTHPFIDESFNTKEDGYGISLIKKVTDSSGFSGEGGKTIGFIVTDVTMDAITNVLQEINLGEGSISGFITSDGREIVINKDSKSNVFVSSDFYQEAIKDTKTSGATYVNYEGEKYLFIYSKIESSNAFVCGLIPHIMIVKQASDIKTITFWFVIIACIVAILIGTLIATSIERTSKLMVNTLSKAAAGDLTRSISVKRKDEFKILADTVNYMIHSMKLLIEGVTRVNNTVSSSTTEVANATSDLSETTKEITQAIDEIEKGVIKQASDTEGCLNQMSSLSDKVNIVYKNTEVIQDITMGTKVITGEGIIMIDELSQKAKATTNITQTVIRNIETLNIESQSIGNIINTMNDIAEQTNLLSLNASIEAARAGAYGRGFAVVADEIRKLADQSLKASNNIGTIISNIQKQTIETVNTAREAESIVESQGLALDKTIESFHKINSRVENLASTLDEIISNVKDMENTKNETLDAMESISSVVEETAAVAEQMNGLASNQVNAVQKLNVAVTGLESDIVSLDESIRIFII